MTIEQAVHRLTGELADWYGSTPATCGSATAPTWWSSTRPASTTRSTPTPRSPVEQYGGLSRMVNRNDAAVTAVLVGGRPCSSTASRPSFSARAHRRFLRAAAPGAPCSRTEQDELASVSSKNAFSDCGRRCRLGTGTG